MGPLLDVPATGPFKSSHPGTHHIGSRVYNSRLVGVENFWGAGYSHNEKLRILLLTLHHKRADVWIHG